MDVIDFHLVFILICDDIKVSSLTSSPDSSPSPGMMTGNLSLQSAHLSSPQQQSVTQIQLQQQQQQQQQQQPDPTKSIQWQISTSSSGQQQRQHQQNIKQVSSTAQAQRSCNEKYSNG